MKALLLILALALTVQSQSVKEGKAITDWVLLTQDRDTKTGVDYKTYFAPGSIRRGDDYTKTWFRADFPNGSHALFTEWNGPDIGSFRGYLTLRCKAHSALGGSVIVYGVNGKILVEQSSKESVTESAGSLGQIILDAFCEREAAPPKIPPKLKP